MKKLEPKPFALIGVNVNGHTPNKLKAVMDKESLTWRSFADEGAILRSWCLSGTPTFYAIDHEGVIRYKWVGNPGEQAIDAALETLIREAEEAARKKSK